MSLKERLNQDLRDAMRAGDTRRRDVLRYLLAAVHNAEIDAGHALDDAGVIAVIQRQVKQRRDSIEEYRKGGRQDLVDKEEAEAAILQSYLPAQMSREEVVEAARAAIEELGARGPADKGKVMPVLIERLRGRAEGRLINDVVTELLAQR
ncbi:MAG TPA: GatB/YqeY domain-containing protein [Dehalococcoidia bacterium]|nr:GatB/YqeY domain-containing protein [Dehalococcoidia bacterium]